MGDLLLYQRATGPGPFLGNYTAGARGWRRSSKRIGGYWVGSFELSQEDLTRAELVEFYNRNVGCRVEERSFGMVSWEGYVVEMRLMQDGVEMMQSLEPTMFHNRVKTIYSDDVGSRVDTDWSENTDSSDEFGECQLIASVGGATEVGATALRDRELTEFAWPRSRIVGGDARSGGVEAGAPDTLEVAVAGYWATLNWRYRDESETDAASDLLSTLVGESEFVTAGRVESNSDSVRVDCYPIPRRLGDLVREIVEQGDSAGDVWQGGVYAGREFVYEEAPTEWKYQLRDGELLNTAGVGVVLSLVEPGFLLFNPLAPSGWARPGTASAWDDPRVRYVDEVELVAGAEEDELRMRFYGAAEGVAVVARRVREGNL